MGRSCCGNWKETPFEKLHSVDKLRCLRPHPQAPSGLIMLLKSRQWRLRQISLEFAGVRRRLGATHFGVLVWLGLGFTV